MSIESDQAELVDIIANFQEGFNTNLHCFELARCIMDAGFRINKGGEHEH